MRIKLLLRVSEKSKRTTFNYQYPLSAWIYKILSRSSPAYSNFLHNMGYVGPDGKLRKLFTFSGLFFRPKAMPDARSLKIKRGSLATLYISSPMINEFIQHFVTGLFRKQQFTIADRTASTEFIVEQVETLPVPQFKSKSHFIAKSPIVLTTPLKNGPSRRAYYYRPTDTGLSEAVRKSLLKKHSAVHGHPPSNDKLEFALDHKAIERHGGPKSITRRHIIRDGYPDATDVIGFIAPFELDGSTELMRTAWECGIGDKCSMGFGCVELSNKHVLDHN